MANRRAATVVRQARQTGKALAMGTEFRTLVLSLPEQHEDLAGVLEEQFGLNRIDARILIHNLPGLLPAVPDEASAKKLAEDIHRCGGYATAVPAADVPSLARPKAIHHARCSDAGLEIFDLDSKIEETWAWDELALINVGSVLQERMHRESPDTTLLHSAPGYKGIRMDMASMRGPEAWLIAEDPLRYRRVKYTEMNYEYLGDRMAESAILNFRMFIDDVISRAKNAYLTPSARAFTEHGLLQHYAFDSEDSLRDHTLFHLLIRRQMRGGAAAT